MTSQINPNNIDATYPVAGQDNDSQGFRDNFTWTKTNFTYAAAEITALQANSINIGATTNFGGGTIYNANLVATSDLTVSLGPITTGNTATLDYSVGPYYTLYTTGSAGNVNVAFSNFAPTGSTSRLRLQANITASNHAIRLPNSVNVNNTGIEGLSGNVITFANPGVYEFEFETSNAGSNISMFDMNRPLNVFASGLTADAAIFLTGSEDLANAANVSLTTTTSYFTTAGTEAATLLDGTDGQIKVLAAVNVGPGDMVVTVSNAAWGGSGTATFDGNGQACTLQYVASKWFCIGNNGVTFG